MEQKWTGRAAMWMVYAFGVMTIGLAVFFVWLMGSDAAKGKSIGFDIAIGIVVVLFSAGGTGLVYFFVSPSTFSVSPERVVYRHGGGESSLGFADMSWVSYDSRVAGGGSFLNFWAKEGYCRIAGGLPVDPANQVLSVPLILFGDREVPNIVGLVGQFAAQAGVALVNDQPPPWTSSGHTFLRDGRNG